MAKYKIWTTWFFISLAITISPSMSINQNFHSNKTLLQSMLINVVIETRYNRHVPDGNSSVLIAMDSNLLGKNKIFGNETKAQEYLKVLLKPFEERFALCFHLKNTITYTPGKNDSLDDSMKKVIKELPWNLARDIDGKNVEGNSYDWLIIYQENYYGGHNRVNSINGNALIVAHNQPFFDRQLILLHEVGHLFGGDHDEDGVVNASWYGEEEYSIMDYEDLITLDDIWDGRSLPFDEVNFDEINETKYRFDLKDPELDGLPNYYEYRYNFDPTINDSHEDFDNDGLSNLEEYQYGTNPVFSDSDQDGFSDWAEILQGTSPLNSTDIPEINIPIIVSWTKQTVIKEKEQYTIEWRAISSNPSYFEIYQNNSIQMHTPWTDELIQHQLENLLPGIWNFTCLVADKDGDKSTAEIWIQVSRVNNTSLILLGPIMGIYCLTIISRKKMRKKPIFKEKN